MKKQDIKQEEEVVIKYTIECPECKLKIKGNSASQVEYNLGVHIDRKHGKEEKKKWIKK